MHLQPWRGPCLWVRVGLLSTPSYLCYLFTEGHHAIDQRKVLL